MGSKTPYRTRFKIKKMTPNKKITMANLLIPCIILRLILVGRELSFLRKK